MHIYVYCIHTPQNAHRNTHTQNAYAVHSLPYKQLDEPMITSHCTQTYGRTELRIRSIIRSIVSLHEYGIMAQFMGDIGSGLLLAKRPGARRQHVKTHLVSGSLPFRSSFFLSLPSLCVCANHSAPDPDLEGSTEKHIHSHEKIAVAAATAAWRNVRQKRHGSRVQREERIQGGCICMRQSRRGRAAEECSWPRPRSEG
jgi:hypothetical protein